MNLTAQGAGLVAVATFTLPALGFALAPVFHARTSGSRSGRPATFETTYQTKVIVPGTGDRRAGKSITYVRSRSLRSTPRRGQVQQVGRASSRCMHLGCPVRYVVAAQRFICPCHVAS
jgi:Rieske Fe-S protein